MSGRKRTYVSVADDELRRLRQAQSRLQDVRKDLPALLDGVRKQVRTEFDQRLASVDDRQRRFEAAVSSLGDDVRSVERAAQRRLDERTRELRADFNEQMSAVESDLSTRLADHIHAVDEALEEERAARQRELDAIGAQLTELEDSVRGDRERAESLAREWLDGAETLRAFIDAELAHERFAPGRLETLSRQLEDARRNADAEIWQAAAVAAQGAHRDLSELRAVLELKEREHAALNALAHERLLILHEKAAANAALPLSEGTDAPEGTAGFVDYWTHGQNGVVMGEIAESTKAVERDELDDEALAALVRDDVPRLDARLDELVEAAGEAELNAQLRVSIADRVVDVLAHNGFDVDIDGGYDQSDQRRRFLAKADHADGSRVVVQVAQSDDGRAELTVHSFDEDTGDDEIRRNRAEALRAQLRAEGLEMGPLMEDPGGPDPRVHDVSSLVERQPEQRRSTTTGHEAVGRPRAG